MMVETARKLAEVRETTLDAIAALTTANFDRLFAAPFATAKLDPLH